MLKSSCSSSVWNSSLKSSIVYVPSIRMCVSSSPLDGRVREVELVLDVADDLFEDVLERDDPVHVAVLVDDDGHVLLLAPEVGEERGEVLRLRDDVRGPEDGLELDRRDAAVVYRAEEVANVEDPEDLVERSSIHGVTRERRVDDRPEGLLGRHFDGDRHHVGSRHHHGGDLLRGEVEDLVEHLLLRLLELTDVLGRGDRVTNVLTRVREHPGGCRVDPKHTEYRVRRHLQQPHDRVRDAAEEVEWDGEHDGERLRLLQGRCLRHELAEHHREVRQDGEGDEEAHRR